MTTQPAPQPTDDEPTGLDTLRNFVKKVISVPKDEADEVHDSHSND